MTLSNLKDNGFNFSILQQNKIGLCKNCFSVGNVGNELCISPERVWVIEELPSVDKGCPARAICTLG